MGEIPILQAGKLVRPRNENMILTSHHGMIASNVSLHFDENVRPMKLTDLAAGANTGSWPTLLGHPLWIAAGADRDAGTSG